MRLVDLSPLAFLKDELSDVDLVGPTLHVLKSLLDVTPDATVTAENSAYSRTIHGLLSACLLNMEEMRGREGAIPQLKTKNNMLAAVLLLTSVPVGVRISQVALDQCCFLVSQRMTEVAEVCRSDYCAGFSNFQFLPSYHLPPHTARRPSSKARPQEILRYNTASSRWCPA